MQYKLHIHPREFSFHIKPQILIIDEDKALSAKVMHYILDVLKVNVKLVSPHTHGSLYIERYINNLITRQLNGKGTELQLYVTSTHPMNTFVALTTGFSPYELVFLKISPLIFPMFIFNFYKNIAKDYEHYCIKMKTRLDNVGNVILDFKRFQQERQAQLANQVTTPPETFQEAQLVYLLAPSATTLSQKFTADFVGPLVVNKV